MPHSYIVSFSDPSINKKIFIHSDHQLKNEEIKALKHRHTEIKAIIQSAIHIDKKIVTLSWNDLNIDKLAGTGAPTPAELSVKEIAVGDIKKLQGPSFSARLNNLLEAKPAHIPLVKFIWKMLLSPLLIFTQFGKKNREMTLRHLKDLDRSAHYDSAKDYLNDFQTQLSSLITQIEKEEPTPKLKELLDHLKEMGTHANIFEQTLTNKKRHLLDETAQMLGAKAFEKFSKTPHNNEALLLSFPGGYYKDGKYFPLMATLSTDKEHRVRLEIHLLGSTTSEDLKTAYRFENPTAEQLTQAIQGLMILSNETQPAPVVKHSRREKIRIKVTRQLNVEKTAETPKDAKLEAFNPTQWLHEKITISGGIPLKKIKETSNKTLVGIIGDDLEHFFPEVPLKEKLEFLIRLVEDHYAALIAAHPHLTAAQKQQQYQLLKFKAKKVEDYLTKRLTPEELAAFKKSSPVFEQFYKKIEQLDSASAEVKQTRILKRTQEIERGLRKSAGDFQYHVSNLDQVTSFTAAKKSKSIPSLDIYNQELAKLEEAIQTKQHKEAYELLKTFQEKIDKLVDKKDYLEAKLLSIKVLQTLPVPSSDPINFWAHASDEYCFQIADLNKHIWESALRLNENAPAHDQLLQMIKSQLIIAKVGKTELDQRDLLQTLLLHPHYRFGWLPEQQAEVNQIIDCLKKDFQNNTTRYDLLDRNFSSFSYKKAQPIVHMYVAQARVQFMTACLMKPDYTIYPFYGVGLVGAGSGVNYLDNLVKEAVNRGAKTAKEKSEEIKRIKYAETQYKFERIRGRLEFESDTFVTETPCVKIYSGFGLNALCYMPNPWAGRAYGLDQYEKKYQFKNDQTNTEGLAGVTRGEETFLGNSDEKEVLPESTQKYPRDKRHYVTVTPQKGYTEPTLLAVNQQRDPRGQVSQVSNFILESAQVSVDGKLSYQTAYEALNLVRTQAYLLGSPEFQRTVLQDILRPGFLTEAIEKNPLFFENFAEDLQSMLQTPKIDEAPFLILLGHIIRAHAEKADQAKPSLKLTKMIKKLPTLNSQLKIFDVTKTVKEWLQEWLVDSEHPASAALSLLYLSYEMPLDGLSRQEIARLMHAYSLFETTGDIIGIPQFNAEIKDWTRQTLIPAVEQKIQDEEFRNHFGDEWIRLATNNPSYSSMNWKLQKNGQISNQNFTIDLKNCKIQAKQKHLRLKGQEIVLPKTVSRHVNSLFGSEPIKATLRKGNTYSEAYYDFTFKNESYSIYHNQASSEIHVYRELPLNLKKPNGKKAWYQYLPQKGSDESLSTLEQMVIKNGLWVHTKKHKQAYVFPHAPKVDSAEHGFSVKLNSAGKIMQAKDPISSLYVVLDKRHALQQVASFADPDQTLFLAKTKKGSVAEMRFLQDGSHLKRKGKEWLYLNEKLGEGYKWLTDLSDASLLLKEKSSAKAFLDSFRGMHEQFILPVSNGKIHTFIIQPYAIKKQKGVTKIEFDRAITIQPENAAPLTITFDHLGKQEGNPSAFLYLAYYFSAIKNFEMAEHYLDLAKKASNSSATETRVLEKLEELLQQELIPTMRGAAFQLKLHLAIKQIRAVQLGETIYKPSNSGEFLDNLLHIAKLYKRYQQREDNPQGALTEEELLQVKHYVQMSMADYLDQYKKSNEGIEHTLNVNFSEFTYFKPTEAIRKDNLPDLLTVLLMSSDLKKEKSVDELVQAQAPSADYIIRNFFHFAFAIFNSHDKPEHLEKLKLFINSPKEWELHKTNEATENIATARFICEYLDGLCRSSPKDVDVPHFRKQLVKARSELPYFDRSFGAISSIIDARLGKTFKIGKVHKSIIGSILGVLQANANPSTNKPDFKGSFDGVKEGRHPTSLQAILDFLATKPDYMSSLESAMITKMIKSGDYNLQEPRELLTLLRESEAREFSVLEIRAETENMHRIQKLEEELANRPKIDSNLPPLNFHGMRDLLATIRNHFPAAKAPCDAKLQQKQATLDAKAARFASYFDETIQTKKTHAEEHRQLKIGVEIAKEKLEEEVVRKTNFSKQEIKGLKKQLALQARELGKKEVADRTQLLAGIRAMKGLPDSLKKMVEQPEIYTEYELLNEIFHIYTSIDKPKAFEAFDDTITNYLLLSAAYQQIQKAYTLMSDKKAGSFEAARALQMVHAGLNEKRYEEAKITDGLVMRNCLVAEARDGVILRQSQLEIIDAFSQNPNQWASLIMGQGKTTYISPIINKILSQKGYFVVSTVPEALLKGNKLTFDKASRSLLDQSAFEFSIPLLEKIPHSLLAEKYLQLLEAVKHNRYPVTVVEELCTLHNLIIQLEDEKLKLVGDLEGNGLQLLFIEKRLHYLRKISQLLHGEAKDLKINTVFFGDEVDDTHSISREVNLAIGKVIPLNKTVRDVTRAIFEMILNSNDGDALNPIKSALLQDAQYIATPVELDGYMQHVARSLQNNPKFLEFLGKDMAKVVKAIPAEAWANYLTGASNSRPATLGHWDENNPSLKYIAAAKQLMKTLKGSLSMKTGNDYGLSDYNGFMNVPKSMKNEAKGMRFGDIFEQTVAQYLGYLEYLPAQSLTDESETFLTQGLKTFQNKYPTKYDRLIEDYAKSQSGKSDEARLTLVQYLKAPEAWKHRFEILDEIVFDGGYITRFNHQISTTVQEMFHGKQKGGITGTLDPYTLPYISDEIQFSQSAGDKKTSTRAVEAETFLRMTMNLPEGIDTVPLIYDEADPMTHLRETILKNPNCRALVNSSGVTSEGMDTLTWIASLRKTPEGASIPFLFKHPKFGSPYLWMPSAQEPAPYKGQPLPKKTITLYGPSDRRGVDLPVASGEFHFFIDATTPLPELMQTLYRARRIGDDQKIILHIPKNWSQQIKPKDPAKGVTYGDIGVYVVNRTADNKEGINETAQLEKILGQLKMITSKYLRQTNPEFDRVEFWDESNIEDFSLYISLESQIFAKLRDLYIKNKEVQFSALYEPVEMIAGTQKILNAFDDLDKNIDALLDQLAEFPVEDLKDIPGKSNLLDDLLALKADAAKMKKQMQTKLADHERFLPEKTAKAEGSGKGAKEQVKELQQEKAPNKESEEDPAARANLPPEEKRNYAPLDFECLFGKGNNLIPTLPLIKPFEDLNISLEAGTVIAKLGIHRGDPLLYLVSAKEAGQTKPKLTLVSKQDYHQVIFDKLRNPLSHDRELHVFSIKADGFSQIDGTSKFDLEKLPDEAMAFKCYLGVKEYGKAELPKLKQWIDSLGSANRSYLEGFLKDKCTQTLYDLVSSL